MKPDYKGSSLANQRNSQKQSAFDSLSKWNVHIIFKLITIFCIIIHALHA